ncbi:MAG TPA: hypothetical protein VD902_22680 [Symbiobacteriaceae bacterium]|nr:hypothetical protein [Symbiobacteriaceae bacterium]
MGSQLLAANNMLIGTTNMLVTGLPEGWRLLEGYARPEVDEWTEYRDYRWVSRGQGVYLLVEPHPEQPGLVRAEVEFTVSASPTLVPTPGGEPFAVGGHEGFRYQGSVPKGLLPRRIMPALKVEWICPHTRRLLRIMLNGMPPAPLDSVALGRLLSQVAAGVQCH